MKRWLWYAVALALILAVSAESYAGSDVGELQPVQTLRVSEQAGTILVETDTGELGEGDTLDAAFRNMEETALGKLFLDTAEYLLIAPGCVELIPKLTEYLRPSCCVCLTEGDVDLMQVGQFLQIHPPDRTLMEYRAGLNQVPLLKGFDGRMELVP